MLDERDAANARQNGAKSTRPACCIVISMSTHAPHLVMVLADDLGFNGVGYRNPELQTPHLDQLAATGVRLEDFYSEATCAPARAALLTGRFGFKLRGSVNNFGHLIAEDGTDLSYTLLPEHLRRMGYRTHLVGKWHQGFYAPHFLPTRRGFDTFFGFLGGCEDHVTQQPCGTNRCERRHRDAGQSRRFKVIGQQLDCWIQRCLLKTKRR